MTARTGNASDFNSAPDAIARLAGGAWVKKGAVSVWVPTGPAPKRRGIAACGTLSGYNRHRRLNELPCIACSDACRDYARRRRGVTQVRQPAPHGTHAAYGRHYRTGTPPCEPCAEAERAYQREAKKRRRRELKQVDRRTA